MDELPKTRSKEEVVEAFKITPRNLDRLITQGKVGYYKAKRGKRFMAEHIGQIRDALEVKSTPAYSDNLTAHGVAATSALRRACARVRAGVPTGTPEFEQG